VADLLTPAFKAGARLARALPEPVAYAAADGLARASSLMTPARRRMAARNLQRADPTLQGYRLHRATRRLFESYGRYWVESFRLPSLSVEELDAGFRPVGFEHVEAARAAGKGAIMVLPHLGSWEWAAFWLTRVRDIPITAVVEQLEPPELFDWFVDLRRSFGMEVVPLGPEAGKATIRALKQNHLLALLSDRDLAGDGVEVTFFGERTTLPAGPAVLALRTGAPIHPTAIYHRDGVREGVVRPALDTSRQGDLRSDIARITQDVAHALEELIRAAPDQWHLLQPNWPSDRSPDRPSDRAT
jgi:KDO2-lipid IV(A) lauroyltransferase